MGKLSRILFIVAATAVLLFFTIAPAGANHSWGNYHWARTANPFTLQLEKNLTNGWDSYLESVSADWFVSSVLDTKIVDLVSKSCKAILGKAVVCNGKYGFNGWLGLATIWVSGDHIVQATAKVNDTYFSTKTYNKPEAKRHVLCQEVGHTFGLGHQTGVSCMDDRNGLFDPAYVSPNAHDYEQLATIYSLHTDSTSTVNTAAAAAFGRGGGDQDADDDFGTLVEKRGRTSVYVKDLGGGLKRFTFVIWADPGKP